MMRRKYITMIMSVFILFYGISTNNHASAPLNNQNLTESNDSSKKLSIRLLHTIHASNIILSLAFSPDGKVLASGGWDKTVNLLSVDSGKEIAVLTGHSSKINSLAFSSDGSILVSGDSDACIKFWNVEMRKEIRSIYIPVKHVSYVDINSDLTIFAATDYKDILVFNDSGKEIFKNKGGFFESSYTAKALSPDGKFLTSGLRTGNFRLWNVLTGEKLEWPLRCRIPDSEVTCLKFSPDSRILAASHKNDSTRLWSVKDGKLLQEFPSAVHVESMAFSPDTSILATGSSRGEIEIWNVKTGRLLYKLYGHDSYIYTLAFNQEGTMLASYGQFGTIKVWFLEYD